MKKVLIILAIQLLSFGVWADNINIAQIDSSSLLLNQEVKVYVSVTGDEGETLKDLKPEMFTISESPDGKKYEDKILENFIPEANKATGINFLLLIDNSGSMYDTLEGTPTEDESQMRITYAKNAIRSFVGNITNPEDQVGIACFNTYYTPLVESTKNLQSVLNALDQISKPSSEEAYTELYAGIALSTEGLVQTKGRKVVILLSDGENFSYFDRKKELHPDYGTKIFDHIEGIRNYQEEGISLFAINYANAKDKNLETVAVETGGTVLNAGNEEELTNVYMAIRKRIQEEYLLTYRADMIPGDKKYVKVTYNEKQSERIYFASTIFGTPLDSLTPLYLIPLFLGFLLWFLLTRIKFEKLNTIPSLEILDPGPGTPLTQFIPLEGNKTVIGSSAEANLTITNNNVIQENHATIMFDEAKNNYTIVSDEEITVNNNYVKKKALESGDVINLGGTTIVFDDEVYKNQK